MTSTLETRDQVNWIWRQIEGLTSWLDAKNGRSDHEITLRIMKITEEAGEVTAARLGMLGQNPRKGKNASSADVAGELCDVIITAMVALTTVTPSPRDARTTFEDHVRRVGARVRRLADVAPDCPECGTSAARWLAMVGARPVDGDRWECEVGHEFTVTPAGAAEVGAGGPTC
jgi:phosphoribosyl-ATP pyrophosphohydrolase